MLRTYEYTCQDCDHSWQDARPSTYAHIPAELGCFNCSSKNVDYQLRRGKTAERAAPELVDATRVGKKKVDNGFKEVLQNIKQNYPGSTIDPTKH